MAIKSFRLDNHAPVIITVTVFQLVTGGLAFVFIYYFKHHMDLLNENFEGALQVGNEGLPCLRQTLDVSSARTQDTCTASRCPQDYFCVRSPTAGLYCQDGHNPCGDLDFCIDLADPLGTCESNVCLEHSMVTMVTGWSYIMGLIAVILDLLDISICFALPDRVMSKAGSNFLAGLVKLVSFGSVWGAGCQGWISKLQDAECYNSLGMSDVNSANTMYFLFMTCQFFSFLCSLIQTPISAYFGGRFQGLPGVA